MIRNLCFIILIAVSLEGFSQTVKNRATLESQFISELLTEYKAKKGVLKITSAAQVDNLFHTIRAGWEKKVNDSLGRYRGDLTLAEFSNIDAYNYLLILRSIATNPNIIDQYRDHLVKNYMIPAMYRDYEMVKRLPVPSVIAMIRNATLGETLSLGSHTDVSKETFLLTYDLYINFNHLFKTVGQSTNAEVINLTKTQLSRLADYYYEMNARYYYYKEQNETAFILLVTGLNVANYYPPKAINLAKKLATRFTISGEKDKAFAILNTLAINTTADYLNRDTLRVLYTMVDTKLGDKMYANVRSKLSQSAFINSGKIIKLPTYFNSVTNAIPAEKLKNIKYILVDFWYTGCAPCVAEIPKLNALHEQLKDRNDILLLSINTDYKNGKFDRAYVAGKSKEFGIKFPVFYDDPSVELNKQFQVFGYPSKFILTAKGELIEKTDASDITLDSFTSFLKDL